MKNKTFLAVSTLTGTIIGAGFLSLPYVMSKSGLVIGLFWMILLSIIMMIINLTIGEIALSSKTIHQLPGYASKYLGRKTKIIVFISSIVGFYAGLTAYLLGEGRSLSFLLLGNENFELAAGIIFFLIVAIINMSSIRLFKKIEPIGVIAILLFSLGIGLYMFNKIEISNLSYANYEYLLLPFGAVLFSFLGTSSIPEIRKVLQKNEKLMKKSIIIGSLIPLFVYTLFVIIILGIHGENVNEIATLSLGRISAILGIFTMFTAFLALSLALKDTFKLDFSLSSRTSGILTNIFPLIFFLLITIFNLSGFVKILGFGGAISGGLLAITILIVHEKIKNRKLERKPEYKIKIPLLIKIVLIIMFILGIIYEIL
ncbi:hypothetical protein HYW76_01150 [Candidatus Pacearchaeota archaeon]|nr:hypothetical protein [Candidatus Pacearchaeota archaeon]